MRGRRADKLKTQNSTRGRNLACQAERGWRPHSRGSRAPAPSSRQAVERGRRNLRSSKLGRPLNSLLWPQRAPGHPAAHQPGARASLGSARAGAPTPAAPAALAAGLPGNTNQMPAFRKGPRAAAAAGGLRLLTSAGRCRAAPQLTSRLRLCHCLAQPFLQPVTESAVCSVHRPRRAPCNEAVKPGYF